MRSCTVPGKRRIGKSIFCKSNIERKRQKKEKGIAWGINRKKRRGRERLKMFVRIFFVDQVMK